MLAVSKEGVITEETWQVAEVSKPLWSILEQVDKDQYVIFGKSGGFVLSLETGDMRHFPREREGYVIDMWIPPPGSAVSGSQPGFAWQGA